ncbi:MAG: tripartite tricarboxylate transporter substrate binding protein [Burkholderiales bacterium]
MYRMLIVAACLVSPGAALAQEQFPKQTVRILVGFTPGSGTDFLARTIGAKLSEMWAQPVVTDNRPGASGVIASDLARRAAPDGHTLLVVSNGHALNPAILSKLPYDTLRDFSGITYLADVPNVLVATNALKVKTLKELLALIRAKPGQINYASSGVGTATHLTGEMFRLAARVEVVHVPYKGSPDAMSSAMGGNIHYAFNPISTVAPLITAGKLTGIGLSTKTRSPVLPDLPTIAESGLPGFDVGGFYGMFAPAKTPKTVKDKIARDIAHVVKLPDTAEKLLTQGATPRTSTPEQLDAFIREEMARMEKVAKEANIRIE